MARFRSKHHAHTMRKPVATCFKCLQQYTEGKPRACLCGCSHFMNFPSKAEARRYPQLRNAETRGEIRQLSPSLSRPRPTFEITHNGIRICKVVSDFSYYDKSDRFIVEDVKPQGAPLSRAFTIGQKLVAAFYGVEIKIVRM